MKELKVPKPQLLKEKSPKERAGKKEKKLAKTLPNSGAFDFKKGDILTDDYLVEHKFTGKNSFRITIDIIKKIEKEAFECRRKPAIIIEFDKTGKKYLVIELEDLI